MSAEIIYDLDAEEYHAAKAVSHSKLKTYRDRPGAFYRKYITGEADPQPESKALTFGRYFHALVLEHGHGWAVEPEGIDRRTTAGKAAWAAFQAGSDGKQIIDRDGFELGKKMVAAILEHPEAGALLFSPHDEARNEVTVRANAISLPWPLQCRIDRFLPEGCKEMGETTPLIVDLKTVESLDATGDEFRSFGKSFYKLGYHRQAGFYSSLVQDAGIPEPVFYFVAVEKNEPYGVEVYKVPADVVALGRAETLADLQRLGRSFHENDWPRARAGVLEIPPPPAFYRPNL